MAIGARYLLLLIVSSIITLMFSSATVYGQPQKGLIDINTASEKELESLKGIGPGMSKKIVANRPYKSVDELSRAGIPAKTIESIKPYISVGNHPSVPLPNQKPQDPRELQPKQKVPAITPAEPSQKPASKASSPNKLAPGQTVNINTATKDQLESLPGIGPVKAQAIMEGRPYAKPEDIMKVRGIKEGTYKQIKDLIRVN